MKYFLPKVLAFCMAFFTAFAAFAQQYRTLDGSGNNLSFPDWGAAHTWVLYAGAIGYADGVAQPGGTGRPNPRFISNQLFSQNTLLNDPRGMSAYAWAWGQFIDHDITLVEDHPVETMDISVPPFDAFFDPAGSGNATIPMKRSNYDPATGTSPANFRKHLNSISAFIDGSAVYGSDEARANWLRTFSGGKLRTSSGGLLPFNTTTGELDAPVDPGAPAMAMPLPFVSKWFVAGDVRANENPFLTAIHTLFVREHNRLCEQLAGQHPGWTDEQLYQQARKLNGGEIAAIVYEEWLPALGVELPAYTGYKFFTHPGIMNEFSAAAFRYGHTTINSTLCRMDHDGHTMPQGDILLRDAFFNPDALMEVYGVEPYFQGMATVVQQDFDAKVIDDLRNFLFGPPGAGGMDLAAINIQRGRDRGLPDYNTMRQSFGLPPVETFGDINPDPLLAQSLAFVYGGNVDDVDPWVGIVSESHMPGSLFGETAMGIVGKQFEALRDGDRFYYENDNGLTPGEKASIKQTRLADVVRRNTSVEYLQDDIFFAHPLVSAVAEGAATGHFSLAIYPNPVANVLHALVETSSPQAAELQVSDLQGRTVYRQGTTLGSGTNMLAIALPAGMPDGLYVLSVRKANGETGREKFLKTGG
ncbi:MAG: peroxidase family protein [Saprospiraceae bacterium]